MQGQEGKYNIKAASKMLGIQPGTLRAWERRYQMIAPIRNELGYRLYSEEHIKILKWLIKKVNLGFTIGQAVSLLENNQLITDAERLQEGSQLTRLLDELLESLIQLNESKAQEIINSLFSLFTVEKVIFEIFDPLLVKVGDLWESGKITSAHEHFITSILRSRIETIFRSLPQTSLLHKAITVCGPGEVHELGLLMFSLFLRRKGFEVIYLGGGISDKDLDAMVKDTHPDFLFLSCTMQEKLTSALSLVTQFSLNYKNLRIGIGGKAVNSMKKSDREQFTAFIVGSLPADWEKWLLKASRMK
jgi:MerR family transcriptional regulator, light-induced transcriptional regulator